MYQYLVLEYKKKIVELNGDAVKSNVMECNGESVTIAT